MKKKLLAIIALVCIAAFALSACGGGGGTSGGGGDNGGGGGGGAAAETFDVGSFTVAIPSGWTAFPQSDIFGEEDADGNKPIDPDTILIGKGTSDEWDALSGPNVRIYYYSPETTIMDSKSFYDNVQDIEGIKVAGVDCTGFSGESIGYTYQFVSYKTDKAQFEISVLSAVDGKETGVTWDNADVMAIMESLAAKNSSGSSEAPTQETQTQEVTTEAQTTETQTTQAAYVPTLGEKNAAKSAEDYVNYMAFSKLSLYNQLTSEYGEAYTDAEANYAISYLEEHHLVNWNEEAVEAAKSYLDFSSYSREGLYEQLTSEYGEGFTPEQAEYALTQVGY